MIIIKSLIERAKNLFQSPTYGDQLQQYIISKYPKTIHDVESLTFQYQRASSKEVWL